MQEHQKLARQVTELERQIDNERQVRELLIKQHAQRVKVPFAELAKHKKQLEKTEQQIATLLQERSKLKSSLENNKQELIAKNKTIRTTNDIAIAIIVFNIVVTLLFLTVLGFWKKRFGIKVKKFFSRKKTLSNDQKIKMYKSKILQNTRKYNKAQNEEKITVNIKQTK